MKRLVLKPLPYAVDALVPFLSPETVRLHHGVHQAAYVQRYNALIEAPLKSAADWQELGFNAAGVLLHEMYWENLRPATNGHTPPGPDFTRCVTECFGSIESFVRSFFAIGDELQGSGWVVLAWFPQGERLVLLPVQNHELNVIAGAVPLLVVDLWEHAYVQQYPGERKNYMRLLWDHHVDWVVVNRRFLQARS